MIQFQESQLTKQNHSKLKPICPHCQSLAYLYQNDVKDHVVGVIGTWNLFQCKHDECRLVFVYPQPDEAQLRTYYQHYITHVPPDLSQSTKLKGFSPKAWLKNSLAHKKREQIYLDQTHNARVLEIGCGNGSNLFKLRKQGWQVTGQEIDPPAIAQARKLGIDVHDADLSTYAGPGNFDAIILVHVIEHLLHPLNVLQEARKLLAPGGQLILITPNPQSFGKTLFRKYWIPLAQPFHVRLYDPLCLSRLAAKAGFTPIRCFTNSTHSGPNIRASIKATLDANPHSIGFKLLKLVGLAYFIEIAVLLFLLLSDACSLGKGDECVLVCH